MLVSRSVNNKPFPASSNEHHGYERSNGHSLSLQSKSKDFRETPGKGRVLKFWIKNLSSPTTPKCNIYQGFHAPIFSHCPTSQLDPRPVQLTLPAPHSYLDASAMPPASAQLSAETNACTSLKASNKPWKSAFFQRSKNQNLLRKKPLGFMLSQKNIVKHRPLVLDSKPSACKPFSLARCWHFSWSPVRRSDLEQVDIAPSAVPGSVPPRLPPFSIPVSTSFKERVRDQELPLIALV